ncbi:hypothetical protein BGP75_07915 [Motiliproteus sp. MSK22-1]|nr:hypothetical protein BGP75_07915 [Motiliproteus sp. MSK22-1]
MICCTSVAFAVLYLQRELGLESCLLCSTVRFIILIQSALFLLAFLHNPNQLGQRAYAALGLITTLAGVLVSIRHIWLQYIPTDNAQECGPGLEQLLESYPLQEAVKQILNTSGNCASEQWQILGISIPQISLVLFALLIVILFTQFRKKTTRSYFS